jgi:hypothetical protein
MKYVEFTYTKTTGEVSDRAIVVTGEPSKFLSGIEVTELDQDGFSEFIAEYRKLLDQQTEARQALMDKFDLRYSYRQFDPAKMSEPTTEWI